MAADSKSKSDLQTLESVDEEVAEALEEDGFESIDDVRDADADDLAEAEGVDDDLADEIKEEADDADDEEDDTEESSDEEEEKADEAGDEDGGSDSDEGSGSADLIQIRDQARDIAQSHIEEEFDGIIEIGRHDDGWYAVVEVIEREAVPDTQDILGQYEIDLDGSGSVTSFRLIDRYRRGDVRRDNPGSSRQMERQEIE